MGIALDGDADRAILVDELGRVWNGDRIVSMLANYLKERGELKNDTVVLTEYSNLAAIQYIQAQGIKVEKVVVGDRAVANKLQELGAVLGGENAGHIIYLPWLNSSDGSFVALFARKIMAEKNCQLADLWPDYEEFPNAQLAVKVREKRDFKEINGWNEAVEQSLQQLNGRGRVFTRYSGTAMKGKGIGSQIWEEILNWGRKKGCKRLEFTSSGKGKKAHAVEFYKKKGAEIRDTNSFRIEL